MSSTVCVAQGDIAVKPLANGSYKRSHIVADVTKGPSNRLSYQDAIEVWRRYRAGEFQNRIAAVFDVNPGRVNEVLKGHKHPGSESAA